ncbi:MAG: pyridoxamine 5'-phosphate oxidase family protein [Parcubacteria group bacterium]|nr:pyridoxamine 5'-phosphate oxidase family protein [Parcubacteria group bacterium]
MIKKVSKTVVRKRVLEFLGQNRLMTLGTASRNKPWAATVFFAYDKKRKIIFYSREDAKHCKHIRQNPHVSVAINHNWKGAKGGIRGLQIIGRATKVPKQTYRSSYALYKARFKWADEFVDDHSLYRIMPTEVWYIDQDLLGHFYRVRVR